MRVISSLSININQVFHIASNLYPANILIIFILLLFVCLILNTFNLQCKDIKKWVNSKLILFYFVLNGFFCTYAAVFKD